MKHFSLNRQRLIFLALASVLTSSLALPLLTLLPGFPLNQVQAANWYNEDWPYRKRIELTSDTNQTNIYHQLTLDTSDASKFNNDCSDLRFTDSQGQLIPHHLLSGCNTTNTQVQLLFAELHEGPQDLYFYYGNNAATSSASPKPFNNPATNVTTSANTEESSAGPIAHWKFNEGYGTTTHDSTTNQNHGTIHGATWQTEDMCPSGRCLYFDGINDYATSPTEHKFGSSNLTLSLWVKPNNIAKLQNIITFDSSSTTNGSTGFGIDVVEPESYRFYSRDAAGVIKQIFHPNISATQWVNLVGIRQGSTIYFYVNGQLSGTISQATINYDKNATAYIAKDASGGREYFKGFIDDPKIYNYARSQQQIQQDYLKGIESLQRQQANLSNGLTGYWKMDEASWDGTEGEVKDSSGNDNHGDAVSGATVEAGRFGGGGAFKKDLSQRIAVNNTSSLRVNLQDITISAWVKTSYSSSSQGLVTYTGSSRLRFALGPSGSIRYGIYSNGEWIEINNSAGRQTVNDGAWHHVAVSFDRDGKAISYIDGVKDFELDISSKKDDVISGSYVVFGFDDFSSGSYLDGSIDEIRIYTRTLSAPEIQQLYTHAPKPVAHYDFEEGSGNTLYDRSGNHNMGTWQGSGKRYGQGKVGKSGYFNGLDDQIEISANNMTAHQGAVSLWAKDDDSAVSLRYLFGYSNAVDGAAANRIYLLKYSDGFLKVGLGKDGVMSAGSYQFNDHQWHHYALVWDSGVYWVYVDGQESIKSNYTKLDTVDDSGVFRIGRLSNYRWLGGIDQLKIYNYARTQQQIVEDMQSGQPTASTPAGYWKFDEGQGSVAHNSGWIGSALDAELENLSTPPTAISGWTKQGVAGAALSFDGVDDYAEVADNEALSVNTTGQMTVSTWVRPTVLEGRRDLVIKGDGGKGYEWSIGLQDNKVFSYLYSSAGSNIISLTAQRTIKAGEWTHITSTVNLHTSTVRIYLNGLLASTNTSPLSGAYTNTASKLRIGVRGDNPDKFLGQVDQLKIYNHTLTPQDILIDYNQSSATVAGHTSTQPTTTDSGSPTTKPSNTAASKYCAPGSDDYCALPVGEWDFEEGLSGLVKDKSGNGNDGLAYGPLSESQGKYGKAVNFSGADGYIDLGEVLDSPTAWTYAAWIKPEEASVTVADGIVGENNNPRLTYGISNGRSRKVQLLIPWTASPGYKHLDSSSELPLNKWSYVVSTVDSTDQSHQVLRIYIDGQLDSERVLSGGETRGPKLGHLINQRDGIHSLPGAIDQVRIYNYARTPAQVAWDYNQGKPVAHYKFNECSGTTIHDSSGNNLHGLLNLGTLSITQPGTCNTPDTAWGLGRLGRYNSGMNFDGEDDRIIVNASPVGSTLAGGISMSAWVYMENEFSSNGWISQITEGVGAGGGTSYVGLYINKHGAVNLRTRAPEWGETTTIQGKKSLSLNHWHHIVGIVRSSGEMRIYVDAINETNEYMDAALVSQLKQLAFGTEYSHSDGGSNLEQLYRGRLDDIQIFNYALTDQQVQTLHNNGAVRWEPQP